MSTVLTEDKLESVVAEKVMDTRGSRCPLALIDIQRDIVHVDVGNVLELWSGNSQCRTDVRTWAEKVGHDFLGFVPAAGYDRIFVRRAK